MKIGVFTGFSAEVLPEVIGAAAEVAEEREFHSLWAAEHVLLFSDYDSRYPYNDTGKLPVATAGVADPFMALSFAAARTTRIRLGTGICIVPQRNPVYTAKYVADLDWLSGGRFDFGIGVGWLREEFEALGVPFERRGARTDEYLRLMQALWSDTSPQRHGEFHDLPDCLFAPKPIQKPHPPIYVGGHSKAAFRRVAAYGQGWYGHNLGPDEVPPLLTQLDSALERCGRNRRDLQVVISPFFRPVDADVLARFRDIGVDQVLLPLVGLDHDGIRRCGDALLTLTRGLHA